MAAGASAGQALPGASGKEKGEGGTSAEKKTALPAEKKEKKTALPPQKPVDRKIAEGTTLHKNWEDLQTGEQMSDKQFIEKKASEYYEIFQKLTGERNAARRVDYR